MKKLISYTLPFIILIIWLMPVSNMANTLNDDMVRMCYICNLFVLAFLFLYEKKVNKNKASSAPKPKQLPLVPVQPEAAPAFQWASDERRSVLPVPVRLPQCAPCRIPLPKIVL